MNMREIGKRAGVSSATVSRVINGSSLVTEETALRVRKIIEEVGFIPNPHATTLKYGRSKTFGLIVPDICNPFYAEFLAGFEHLLGEIDYELLFTNVTNEDGLVASVRRMLMRQVDGAVLMASEFDTKAIESLLLHKVPLVTIDRRTVQRGCSDLAFDYETGFQQAVEHLRSLGHKQIGFIGGTEGLKTSKVRFEAFKRAIAQCEMSFQPSFVQAGNYRVDGGEAAIRKLWQSKSRPTAVLTVNDLTAFGVIRGLHGVGYSVPNDVSVIGVDDVLLSDVMQPRLTTIRLPRQRLAATCLKALNYTRENVEKKGGLFSVPTELIIRESSVLAASGRSRK